MTGDKVRLLRLYYLEEVEFDWGFPAKDRDENSKFAFFFVDFVDSSQHIGERSIGNPDSFTDTKGRLELGSGLLAVSFDSFHF